jgi:hypothetical protein
LFEQTLRPLRKPSAFSKGEFINIVVYLNDGTILTSKLMTTVDKVNGIPFAYPSSVELEVLKGGSAYEFETNFISDQSPVIRNKEMVTVDFEYTIAFSKSRGSSEEGGETGTDYTVATSVDVNAEHSDTKGTEQAKSTSESRTESSSENDGVTGTIGISFFDLLSIGVSTDHDLTTGKSAEWTVANSLTEMNTSTNTTGVTTGNSISEGKSNNQIWKTIKEDGNDESYLNIKGVLTTSDIGEETMILSIDGIEFSSPNMKGLTIEKFEAKKDKTIRWKK